VAELPKLFRLKCASHRYAVDTNSTHFKRNNPLVYRVSVRYNHGSTGPKQVYLTRRRVYNHNIAHQLLIYRNINIITTLVQLSINSYEQCLKRQATQLVQVHSGRKVNSRLHMSRRLTPCSARSLVSLRRVTTSWGRIPLHPSQTEQKLAMQGYPWGSRRSYLKDGLARLSILILSKTYPLRGILSQIIRLMKAWKRF
jgi:hypothetical protein